MSQALFPRDRMLWLDPSGRAVFDAGGVAQCCDDMRCALQHQCDQHDDPFDCPDMGLSYAAVFNEYGLIVHDGGASFQMIRRCPWCGAALEESRRDAWFDALATLGNDDPLADDAPLPEKFRSAAWWMTP